MMIAKRTIAMIEKAKKMLVVVAVMIMMMMMDDNVKDDNIYEPKDLATSL